MSMQQMMMASGRGLGATLVSETVYRTISFTSFVVNADGYVYHPTSGTQQYLWKTGGGVAADYEIRSTITGGTPGTFSTDPSAGSWVSLGSSQTWQRGGTSGVTRDVTATFEIRDATTLEVLTSKSITLTCDVP